MEKKTNLNSRWWKTYAWASW